MVHKKRHRLQHEDFRLTRNFRNFYLIFINVADDVCMHIKKPNKNFLFDSKYIKKFYFTNLCAFFWFI